LVNVTFSIRRNTMSIHTAKRVMMVGLALSLLSSTIGLAHEVKNTEAVTKQVETEVKADRDGKNAKCPAPVKCAVQRCVKAEFSEVTVAHYTTALLAGAGVAASLVNFLKPAADPKRSLTSMVLPLVVASGALYASVKLEPVGELRQVQE
jgi:hypothetical protein